MQLFSSILQNFHITNSSKDDEFYHQHQHILFERIKLVSYMLILTYPCFFIVDFFFFSNVDNLVFKYTLFTIHFLGFLFSILYLFLYKFVENLNKSFILNGFLIFYLLLGAIGSINSQLLTGNINAYLIVLFGVSVIFPIRPGQLFYIIFTIHLFFIVGLSLMNLDHFSLLTKQINSTGTAVIAYIISYSYFSYHKRDFINQYKIKESENSFRRIFNMSPTPLVLLSVKENKILLMNNQAIDYYRLPTQDVSKMDGCFLFTNDNVKNAILNDLIAGKSLKNYVMPQQISLHYKKWAMFNFELIEYLDDTCILIGITDVTNFKKTEEELYKQASFDVLTGVMNRRSGIELLRHELSRHDAREFIIYYIDINNLKTVNDLYGHAVGDELIKTACEIIDSNLEGNDILFRLGGDEFILVFFEKPLRDVKKVWRSITADFKKFNQSNQQPFNLSVSHGYYHYQPNNPISLEEILEFADQEMYKVKKSYKNKQISRNS